MANAITLAQTYTTLIDELYRKRSLTTDLTIAPELVRAGANARTVNIPKVSVSGLGDYDRNAGFSITILIFFIV